MQQMPAAEESSAKRAINWGNLRPAAGSLGSPTTASDFKKPRSLRWTASCKVEGLLLRTSKETKEPPKCQKFKSQHHDIDHPFKMNLSSHPRGSPRDHLWKFTRKSQRKEPKEIKPVKEPTDAIEKRKNLQGTLRRLYGYEAHCAVKEAHHFGNDIINWRGSSFS